MSKLPSEGTITPTTRKPLPIAICGAGLAGLTAAYVLASRGHHILLYDARRARPVQGAGIMIRPNASRILASWGLGATFSALCDESPTTGFYNLETGAAGERRQAVDISEWPDWGLSRRQAWDILHDAANRAGVQVRWATSIDGLMARGNGVRVRVHGARMEDVDLVLDATGAHSKLRSSILGVPRDNAASCSPRFIQGTAYSLSVPASQAASHSDARDLLTDTSLKVWMGGKDRYVVQRYHEKAGDMTLLCFVSDDETQDMKGFWDEDGDIEHLRAVFKGRMAPALYACLEMATHCSRWKFNEMPDLEHWVSKSGRIALLGDSAHSMLPNAAQGFTQIVEDIGALDYLLHERQPELSVSEVMNIWQEVRIPRVNRIKAFALWNTNAFTGLAPPSEWRKDESATTVEVSLKDTKPDPNAKFRSAAFLKWAMDYDAVSEARKCADAKQAGKSRL